MQSQQPEGKIIFVQHLSVSHYFFELQVKLNRTSGLKLHVIYFFKKDQDWIWWSRDIKY